jgi:endonuclease YncB( thermonuclease family)
MARLSVGTGARLTLLLMRDPGLEFVGKVVGVIDGDSIRVMHEGQAEQIRLIGIDCPEKRQPFGTRAKEYTSELAFGQAVTVYVDKRDRFGRRVAEVLLPDGRSLNQELIKAGLAWWYRSIRSIRRWEIWSVGRGRRSVDYGENRIQYRPGSGGSRASLRDSKAPNVSDLFLP